MPRIRRARRSDLEAIQALEEACFQDYRQASRASLQRSLERNEDGGRKALADGRGQSVWVVDRDGGGLAALLVLWHFPHRIRVYDVATHPEARGQGLGRLLMEHAEGLARRAGAAWITLEAEEQDPRLVAWYKGQGFDVVARLPDFYHEGCSALRMLKRVG